ncbi:MAG: hypothetical protein NTX61_14930 [Bacteroidetes bacterium]|nr:hypothetical protein [Bacteroidota bacterium]
MKKIFLIILSLALFSACERKIDKFTVSKGNADFTKFITVGNSLIAGYADGALYHNGQLYSIPNILAGQLQLAGSGTFVQPMVTSEYGVDFPGSGPKFKLGPATDCMGAISLGPVPDIGTKDPFSTPVGYPVNNFGIPGAKSFHLLYPGYAKLNPYYYRFALTPLTGKVVEDIVASNASFFALWLGDNDVLQYALAGGAADSITSPAFFTTAMGGVLQALTLNHAKGVIATIPDITTIPYFTTVPWNGLVLDKQQADTINYAMGLFQLPFHYVVGRNPFLVADPTSAHPYFKVRQMVAGELVLLTVPQDSMKCHGMGIINAEKHVPYPIPNQYVLTADEVSALVTATTAYNEIIKTALAPTFGLAIVDMNEKLKTLSTGISWNGISLSTVFVTGGAFSLDGIHLNPRGNALAANFFIEAINAKFGSTIPEVDITKYPGVIFP